MNEHTKSKWRLTGEGLKQSGVVMVFLILLGVAGWGCAVLSGKLHYSNSSGWTALILCGFSGSVLIGPVTPALTFFDISNKELFILSLILIPLYWILLGWFAGFVESKTPSIKNCEGNIRITSRGRRMRWTIVILAFALALLSWPRGPINGPGWVSSGRNWIGGSVLNNLRQIDGAKAQLALEKMLSDGQVVIETDLAPYLKNGRFVSSIAGERYVINPIGEDPYAVVDSDWRFRRRGWREGYTIPKGTEYRLPTP